MTEVDFYIEDLKSKFAKIDPKKYYLAYSGGKDSHFLYWFIKEILHDTDIKIVSVNTYMEFPEILARMKKYADVVLTPKMKPHEVIEKYGTPCFSKFQDDMISRYQRGNRSDALMERFTGKTFVGRDGEVHNSSFSLNQTAKNRLLENTLPKISPKCCEYLKKKPSREYEQMADRKSILGVMADESRMRKLRYKSCFTKSGKFTPLWDCTEKLMNEIYSRYNIELPSIYQYVNQTGCAGCPYGLRVHDTEIELQLMSQNKRRYVISLFGEAYRIRGFEPNQMSIYDFIDQPRLERRFKHEVPEEEHGRGIRPVGIPFHAAEAHHEIIQEQA